MDVNHARRKDCVGSSEKTEYEDVEGRVNYLPYINL